MMVDPREVRQLELIGVLDPRVIERARRLAAAIELLRSGYPPLEVRAQMRLRFGLEQSKAWRLVDMAVDLAGPT